MFDPKIWGQVPFHFWTLCFFVFGSVVGSFLNVCIYRLPRGESVVHPASHCPHCGYSIPWHLNIPLVTWLWLRARCAHCGRPISIRYFLVELLTGTVFALCWLRFGPAWAGQAMVYCLFIAGLIAATFIDFEHFIIPDEITVGGMVAGFLLAFFVPGTHRLFPFLPPAQRRTGDARKRLGHDDRGGRWSMGFCARGNCSLDATNFDSTRSRIVFTESSLQLPAQNIPYEDIFYRSSDTIRLQADASNWWIVATARSRCASNPNYCASARTPLNRGMFRTWRRWRAR